MIFMVKMGNDILNQFRERSEFIPLRLKNMNDEDLIMSVLESGLEAEYTGASISVWKIGD